MIQRQKMKKRTKIRVRNKNNNDRIVRVLNMSEKNDKRWKLE